MQESVSMTRACAHSLRPACRRQPGYVAAIAKADGYLVIDANSGTMVCANLPMLN